MNIKKILLFSSIIFFSFQVYAGRFVRYNVAGYDPVRPKKVIVMADNNCIGYTWRIRNSSTTIILNGTIGASVAGTGNYMPKAFNHEIDFTSLQTLGTYSFEIDNIPTFNIAIKCKPYAFILPEILRTIRVRRSGSADALDHPISHLGDASCPTFDRVGTNNGNWVVSADGKRVNMLGGFYDAGDYIKFTLTNAYLTYYMLRSYETAPELFDGVKTYSTTSLDDLLDESKWGLEFLMKTMPDANEFIIQTGGYLDHDVWPARLPQNDLLDGNRECYSAFSRTQMGLTVAALALGSKIFAAKGLTVEATAYRAKAIQIYTAARASTTTNAWWEGTGEVYYADNTLNDNMELAAIELYLLTNTASYLTDAQTYGTAAGSAWWSSWGNVNLTAHSRLLPFHPPIQTAITADLTNFQGIANAANNRWRLPHTSVWGSLYSQFSVAHGAMQYKAVSGSTVYDQFGYDVVDYTFGRNAWGLGFIATQNLPSTITSSYATIYRLQPGKFPHGEIAEGPAPAAVHSAQTPYFSPAHNPALWHSLFNTSEFTFFEQPGDYVCMETTICGLADGLFLMALASKSFCTSPLPVDMIDFNAVYSDRKVLLQWETSEEVNNNFFSIERSLDGILFSEIGKINGKGNSSTSTNYSFTDNTPLNGTSYYRLAQHDYDGSRHFSSMVSMNIKETGFSDIYPNPFDNYLVVPAELLEEANTVIKVFDLKGEVVYKTNEISANGIISLPTELPEGIYMLQIQKKNNLKIFKIIKGK